MYQYDPAGNITSMSLPGLGTKTFTYDADNRITNSGFSYDANGNLTSAAMYGTNYQYSYDAENRLTTVKDSSGNVIASYTYDADGNRLSKTADGTTTLYHYFQGQLMYETVGSTITALYLRSSDGQLLGVRLNQNGTNNYYYYHYDAQGDVIAVTKADGSLYRQYVYDPYGNIISVKDGSGNSIDINNDSGFNNAYTYRGYRFDSETGLYFLQSRYYAAGICRFLTKDTNTTLDYSNSKNLNLYAYSEGDPVNKIDPDGKMAEVLAGAWIIGEADFWNPVGWVLLGGTIGYAAYDWFFAKDSSKSERHGDGGRALDKAQKQIQILEEQLKTATGREADKIRQKIKNIERTAKGKAKGETHWR
ncbi:RHS repeat domain-containing protein [Desulfosporosinus sp. SYSU MS00001]|uniref:RHS repeat domain-containing protein n=1 Tax=Desulfosporosinus sp. SYSU MS00001 TaxID=3416284 RepID=UPI003CF1708B